MNQITDLRAELVTAQQALEAHELKYYFTKGYGTGWKGSHYGISQEEYDAAFAQSRELRGRVLSLMQRIEKWRHFRSSRRVSILSHV